jgi:hypothetical protein
MIRHEAVAQDVNGLACAPIVHRRNERFVVTGLVEHRLAMIAAVQHVVPDSANGGSGSSRHRDKLSEDSGSVNNQHVPLFCPSFFIVAGQKSRMSLFSVCVAIQEMDAGEGRRCTSGSACFGAECCISASLRTAYASKVGDFLVY